MNEYRSYHRSDTIALVTHDKKRHRPCHTETFLPKLWTMTNKARQVMRFSLQAAAEERRAKVLLLHRDTECIETMEEFYIY
jgi:hypothetical protein